MRFPSPYFEPINSPTTAPITDNVAPILIRRGFTLHHVMLVFRDPVLRAGLVNAFGIAVFTTTLSALIALPLAVLARGTTFPSRPP